MTATLGALIFLASGGLLWAALPKGEEKPVLFRSDIVLEVVPVAIVSGFALGLGLVAKGLFG